MRRLILLLSIFFCLGAKGQMTGVSLSGSIKMFDSTRLYRDSVLRHYSGADIVDLDTIRLTSSGGGSYTSSNGITLTSSNFKLGGNLTENTSIGSGGYTFSLNNKVYNNTSQRWNEYTDTVNVTLNAYKFLHTTSLAGGGHLTNSNLFLGRGAGQSVASTDSAAACTGIGTEALNSLNSATNAAGSSNTAVGYRALKLMRYGVRNTVVGTVAMGDCAVGTLARPLTANIAIGHHAYRQGASDYNIAIGASAMENANDDFTDIIAIGQYAMQEDSASFNIGIGYQAGKLTKNGGKNVFLGWNSGALGVASEKNFYGGYYSGYNILGVGANVAIGSGAMQGGSGATGNTDVAIGQNAFNAVTTGSRNVFIGNNSGANGTVNVTTGSDNIVIGNATSISAVGANNELNLGNALFGQNFGGTATTFIVPRLTFGKRSTTANATIDMGLSALPIILPKSASTPTVGLETAMTYYNTNTDCIEFYSGVGGFTPIVKVTPTSVVTSNTGIAVNANVYKTVLNATSNTITQTIPAASSSYKNHELVFLVINSSVNATTFSIPSSSYVNGVTGATSFVAANGAEVKCSCDGSVWYITNK